MKELTLAVATFGLALAALGQGAVILDNANAIGWVDLRMVGNHYTGNFGLELWMKNGNTPDTSINSWNGQWPATSYPLLAANGFTLQTRISGLTMTSGIFGGIGEVDMPGVNRSMNNGNAVLGLVIWTGNAPTIVSAGNGGVLTFVNPTSDYTVPPPNTPVPPGLDGMNQDLVIWVAPEPGTFALAGLGAAFLLILRRRS